jgi:hypothetical protein
MRTKPMVFKVVLVGILTVACLSVIALASARPQQEGAVGYHLIKTVKLSPTGGDWDYLSIDPENRRLFVSQENHVIVLNLDTDDIVGDIPNTPGVHGVAVANEFGRGFTSNGDSNNVTGTIAARLAAPLKIFFRSWL